MFVASELILVTNTPNLLLMENIYTPDFEEKIEPYWALAFPGLFLESSFPVKVGKHYPKVCIPLGPRKGYVPWYILASLPTHLPNPHTPPVGAA